MEVTKEKFSELEVGSIDITQSKNREKNIFFKSEKSFRDL